MTTLLKPEEKLNLIIVISDNPNNIITLNTDMYFNTNNKNVTKLFNINTSGNRKADYSCGNQYFNTADNATPVIIKGKIDGFQNDDKYTNHFICYFDTAINSIVSSIEIYDNKSLKIKYNKVNFQFGQCFCFCEDTKILSLTSKLKEEYRLVQDLKIGDFVKSYKHGYRKVSKILKGSFVNNPTDEGVANCMYIYIGTKMLKTDDNELIEDLKLTRNHGILVDKLSENEEMKVDKNNLTIIDNLISVITADCGKFEKVMNTNVYKYYHFALDGDGDNDRRFGKKYVFYTYFNLKKLCFFLVFMLMVY
jgi:hypothetical protein